MDPRIQIQDPDPDPLVRGMDPRIRIRTKMSWIRKTAHLYKTDDFVPSRRTFEKFDTDKNGEIDSEEFGRLGECS
jgi:hypothetical protein